MSLSCQTKWSICLVVSLLAACTDGYSATANLNDGSQATITLSAIFSLQSDWDRKLTIHSSDGDLSLDLFTDTGWWRGSNLYLSREGFYVLNEGQLGCYFFTTKPPREAHVALNPCDNAFATSRESQDSLGGYPASHFYPNLFYVGRFDEDPRSEWPAVFLSSAIAPEKRLPDEM